MSKIQEDYNSREQSESRINRNKVKSIIIILNTPTKVDDYRKLIDEILKNNK